MKNYIKRNLLKWGFMLTKGTLIAYFSFYLLKAFTDLDFVNQIWMNSERYYLASYVIIQAVTGFILYEGFGKLLEWYINKWIKKNEEDMTVDISREDEREVSRFVHLCFSTLLWFRLFTPDELNHLDEFEMDGAKHAAKWNKTIWIIQNCIGIACLGLINLYLIGIGNGLFITLIVILAALIFLCGVGLIVYSVLIKNLHLINAFIRGYNVSCRMNKKLG